ncbi:radical SAM family heme chaperone HemW [Leptolyngbya sp. FACHB-261]|uniref:radical SAM family heme chaperone HemW n=1 Tax=Leptolyngbya sp. FACHB-261 TaxID=2692806 RepID=UPI001685FD86|nr:radical SAM family heme chaperone HemW [Leptolyngbya sp. FACHB-261]MBD2101489.1 coproporphyrinogen III oxidase [Leptolyngbya sp. FACHB-261]
MQSEREYLPELLTAAYLHIPFCRRRCAYCDFAISLGTEALIERYVGELLREIAATPIRSQQLQTVFFGGGTPSLLSVAQMERLLQALHLRFGIAADAEISIEANPGTVTVETLSGYRAAGVNRVSLGVQAFQPELLSLCGRDHTVAEIYEAVEALAQAGIPNFNLDLISGLPQQTISHWQDSLAALIAIAPSHVSIYDLTIEQGTAFGRRYQPGDQPLPSDEATVEMYGLARETLVAAGYEHYEISNYARPGFRCRHNQVYWRNQPYYGLGMAATSYVDRRRIDRPRKLHDYFAWVDQLAKAPEAFLESFATTQPLDELVDTLILGLRLQEGLSLTKLRERFGAEQVGQVLACLERYQRQGWVQVTEDRLRLSDPEGFLFCNTVLVALMQHLGA